MRKTHKNFLPVLDCGKSTCYNHMHKHTYEGVIKLERENLWFKALSDRTRFKIVWLLLHYDIELCICEITDAVEKEQSTVSRHMEKLKQAGIASGRQIGKWVYHKVQKPRNDFQKRIFEAIKAIPEDNFSSERDKLENRLSLRKEGLCVVGSKKDDN